MPYPLRLLMGVLGLVMLACRPAPAPPPAGGADYLPLREGTRWELNQILGNAPMAFEVVGRDGDAYRVRWENPWLPKVEYRFRPAGNRILITALDMGEGLLPLPPDTVYFDFGAAEGTRWSNSLGTYTVVSRTARVSTPAGDFDNCIHIRVKYSDGSEFDWVFAPGVGFVQFGQGEHPHVLTALPSPAGTAGPAPATRPEPKPPAGPARDRILAMDVTVAEDQNFERAFNIAESLGIQAVTLSLDWKDIETGPGKYRDPDSTLATANAYYAKRAVQVALDIRPIHTNRRAVPADLDKEPFDSPIMIERFNRVMDYVLEKLPDLKLAGLYIGSEIDIHLGGNAAGWRQYRKFYEATRKHVKERRPNLNVGVETTFAAATKTPTRQYIQDLNTQSDIIGISYYHIDPDTFEAREPKEIGAVFREIASLYPNRPIYFHQFGYPSARALESSETKQAQFIHAAFEAWDAFKDRIRFIAFVWLTDSSPEALDSFRKYYGFGGKNFLAFLGSLGYRTYPGAGTDKPALRALRTETKARGWAK